MERDRNDRIVISACVLLVSLCTAGWGRVIYVDDDAAAGGNGSSWANACRYLQDALMLAAEAPKPVEIHVAQGTYRPDQGAGRTPGDRAATFELLNGVTLQGGYAGLVGADPNARDVELYETILSGDLRNNDVEVKDPNIFYWPRYEPTRAENSLHVVTARGTDDTAVLDGLVISGGCTFTPASLTRNEGIYGAGMFNDGACVGVVYCEFRDNVSVVAGGAVYNSGGKPLFAGSIFKRNFAGAAGGAMYTSNSNLQVLGCTFVENATAGRGGALVNSGNTDTWLTNCGFQANEARTGGAVYNEGGNTVYLTFCSLTGNRAFSFEGGGALAGWADLVLTSCRFHRNTAQRIGGALCTQGQRLEVAHCIFSENAIHGVSATEGGGALGMEWGGIALITNTGFDDNTAPHGGAVYCQGAYARMTRCCFRHNTAPMPDTSSDPSWRGGGGAVLARYSTLKFTGCEFQGNRTATRGGAIESDQAKGLALTNCLLAGNRAQYGGAIRTTERDLRLESCTLASNSDVDGWAQIRPAVLDHCIVWGGDIVAPSGHGVIAASYCDVQGGYPGHGNIDMDPLFVRPGHWVDAQDPNVTAGPNDPNAVWLLGDYHLQSQAGHWDRASRSWVCDGLTSPCIDAGDFGRPTGFEPSPNGGMVNLGAYGGTAEASKSYFGGPVCETRIPGDLNGDCQVDNTDAILASQNWRQDPFAPANRLPAITITTPTDGAVIEVSPANPTILIVADASDPDGSVREVYFSVTQRTGDGSRQSATADNDPGDGWHWHWKFLDPASPYAPGQYTIAAHAIDDDCEIAFAPEVHIAVIVTK